MAMGGNGPSQEAGTVMTAGDKGAASAYR